MVLLHWKKPLHSWVLRLGDRDFEIIVRFVLIALVILPVLPDQDLGPYSAFNPFTAWLMVVLIVGINLVGFVAFRLVGTRAGGWLAGLLGGLVSKRERGLGPVAALVILVASAVVYGRVLVELAVVAPDLLESMAGPAATFTAILLVLSVLVFRAVRSNTDSELPERENPARIRQALVFAALYVVILFGVAAAREHIGTEAVYAVAFVSGLTDVDALTVSVAQLYSGGETPGFEAWRVIFLATLSNLLFKILAASILGSSQLRAWILGTGAVALATGVAMLVFWP